jgi:hypothetical protein
MKGLGLHMISCRWRREEAIKPTNCVILCVTKPDCHLNFAHGGDPGKRILLTQFAFPNWIFKNSTEQG